MTPEVLLNRFNFTPQQQPQQQPASPNNDLDRRLHQYRSKLLAATNKVSAPKPGRDTSRSATEALARNNTEPVSREPVPEKRTTRKYSITENSSRLTTEKATISPEEKPAPYPEASNLKNAVNSPVSVRQEDQLSTSENQNLQTAVEETLTDINHADEHADSSTSTNLDFVTAIQAHNLLQQPVEPINLGGQSTTTPHALTQLFSRFDRLSLPTPQTALNNTSNNVEAVTTEVPAIPSGLARFLTNKNFNAPATLETVFIQPQDSQLVISSSSLSLEPPALTSLLVPELNEPVESTAEVTKDLEVEDIPVIPLAETTNPIVLPTNLTFDQTVSINIDNLLANQSNLQPKERTPDTPQVEPTLAEVKFASTEINLGPAVNAVEVNEPLTSQPPLLSSSLSETASIVNSGITPSTAFSIQPDETSQLDSTIQIDPSLYTSGTPETKGVQTTTQLSEQQQGQQVKDIINQLKQAFSSANETPATMRVRLNPPELGMLQIDIQRTEHGIVARVQAESPHAHQLIKEGLQQLKESLALQGQLVQSIQIDLTPDLSEDHEQTEREPQQQQQHSSHDESGDHSQESFEEESFKQKFRKEYITEMDMEI